MHDMREILDLAKADPPPARLDVDDILAAGRRRKRRVLAGRVAGAGVAIAAITAALMVSSTLAPAGDGRTADRVAPAETPPPAAVASPPFTFTFSGYEVGDYRVLPPDKVNPAYQVATVTRRAFDAAGKPSLEYAGSLTVFQPGVFSPEKFRSGTATTVHGREAFQLQLAHEMLTGWPHENRPSQYRTVTSNALAWQYAPDAWAVIDSGLVVDGREPMPFADEVTVAAGFTPGNAEPTVAKLPFKPGYLPAGYTLLSVDGQSLTAEHSGMVSFVYGAPEPMSAPLTGPREFLTDRTIPSVVISILWVDNPPPDAPKRTSRCNPGQHWCTTTLPDGKFYVAVEDPAKTLSDEELLKVSDGLAFATIKDPATWYPAV